MRPPGSGATSDYETRQYLEGLPGLGKTAEGNEIIANTQQSLLAHRQAVAEIASRALAGEIEPREAEKMIRELPDPMKLWRESRGKSPAGAGENGGWTVKRVN
jgi:tRNA(Ile2) C34 agmatinyltransferase TiaS